MRVRIDITRRPEISDPQGTTIAHALTDLGHDVADVRVDRVIHLDIQGADEDAAVEEAERMCRELLANPVIEDFTIEIVR